MKRFIKSKIIDTANTYEKLCGIDILNQENHSTYSKIDIDLAAEEKLKRVGCSDKQIMEFKMQCKEFLIGVLKKILEKSPVKYSIVRYMACLDPRSMANDRSKCRNDFQNLMKHLISIKRIDSDSAETVLRQYELFLESIPALGTELFSGFIPAQEK